MWFFGWCFFFHQKYSKTCALKLYVLLNFKLGEELVNTEDMMVNLRQRDRKLTLTSAEQLDTSKDYDPSRHGQGHQKVHFHWESRRWKKWIYLRTCEVEVLVRMWLLQLPRSHSFELLQFFHSSVMDLLFRDAISFLFFHNSNFKWCPNGISDPQM